MRQKVARIVLLGSSGVGKTSLAARFARGTIGNTQTQSGRAAYFTKTVAITNQVIRFDIWDMPGGKQYQTLWKMFYETCDAALILFDVTLLRSYSEAIEILQQVSQSRNRPLLGIVANKIDAPVESWNLDLSKIKQNVNLQDIFYIQISARDDKSVRDMFTGFGELLLERLLNPDCPRPETVGEWNQSVRRSSRPWVKIEPKRVPQKVMHLLTRGVTKTFKKSKFMVVNVETQEYTQSIPCVHYLFTTAVTSDHGLIYKRLFEVNVIAQLKPLSP